MVSTTITEEKERLRRQLKAAEAAIPLEARRAGDEAMFRRFLALPEVERAHTAALFWGIGAEPDTAKLMEALLRRGVRVALPRCLPGWKMEFRFYDPALPMVRHRYGMLEPDGRSPLVDPAELDVVLVPALCYDKGRMRLGRGGGYYDRFLAGFQGFTVGLCREALLQKRVPRDEWDQGVTLVLTEERSIGSESGNMDMR